MRLNGSPSGPGRTMNGNADQGEFPSGVEGLPTVGSPSTASGSSFFQFPSGVEGLPTVGSPSTEVGESIEKIPAPSRAGLATTVGVMVAGLFLLAGFGCRKGNTTPFRLPDNGPPAANTPVFPEGGPAQSTAPPRASAYLIALAGPAAERASTRPDAKKIGCDDYAVPVTLAATIDPKTPLRDTMAALVAATDKEANGLGFMTALSKSSLTVGDIATKDDGTFVIDLVGTLSSGGVCDDPRIKAQVELTAKQFGKAEIRLNGSESKWRCLGDQSGRCK